jgi:hypothetical protein
MEFAQIDWVATVYQRAGLMYLREGVFNDMKRMIFKGNLDPSILGYLHDELRDLMTLTASQLQFLSKNLGFTGLNELGWSPSYLEDNKSSQSHSHDFSTCR